MADNIYVVDPIGKKATRVHRTDLASAGIKERGDLQEWVLAHPEILGEPLLIITSEFAAFDRSNRRLDILALDTVANLVVIELKLDIQNTFADLQALRYAAFCSAMTMDQVIEAHAHYSKQSVDNSEAAIRDFLSEEGDDLPEPSDRPRIILVAGSLDDIEITSTALWLRKFDVDIQCLELTTFRISDGFVIVPRLVIPLPEAREYQVRVERKEATKAHKQREVGPFAALFTRIQQEFEGLTPPEDLPPPSKPRRAYMQIRTGKSDFHYEWLIRQTSGVLHVALHFESKDAERNRELLALAQQHQEEIQAGVDARLECTMWGRKWAYAAFVLELPQDPTDADLASRAARLMEVLMRRTWPIFSLV